MYHVVHHDLIIARRLAYDQARLMYQHMFIEKESQSYGACVFEMNNRYVKFRVGKITPTKTGQFVTLWKRIDNGLILPYDMADPIDLLVVSVRRIERLGQFVFPKIILYEKGFISKDGKGGKRAMRVYPPWDITDSKQARKAQSWQSEYFFEINQDGVVDIDRVKRLFLQ